MTEAVIARDENIPLYEESFEIDDLLSLSAHADDSSSAASSEQQEWQQRPTKSTKKNNRKSQQQQKQQRCITCGSSFRLKRSFERHLLQHVGQPRVCTARCDGSELYTEALRRSSRISGAAGPLISAPATGGIRLKIKLDGSGAGNNFEVVSCTDERSRGSCSSNGSSKSGRSNGQETTQEPAVQQHVGEDSKTPDTTHVTDGAAPTAFGSVTAEQPQAESEHSKGSEEASRGGNLNEQEEETLASLLSKSINDGGTDEAGATVDPFGGLLQEEREHAASTSGLQPLTVINTSEIKSSPYYPSSSPVLPCRLAENVMVELNTSARSSSLSPAGGGYPTQESPGQPQQTSTTMATTENQEQQQSQQQQDSGKLLQQMLSGVEQPGSAEMQGPPVANEYMSLDKLPMQHVCAVCSVGYPELHMLEEHCRLHGHGSASPYTQLQTPQQQQQQQQQFAQQQYGSQQQQSAGQQQSYPSPGYPPAYGAQHNIPYGQPSVPMEQLAQQVRNMPLPPPGQQLPHNNMGIRYMTQQHMIPSQQQPLPQQPSLQPQQQNYGPMSSSQQQPDGTMAAGPQVSQSYGGAIRGMAPSSGVYRMQRPPMINGAGYPQSSQQYYQGGPQTVPRGGYTRYQGPRGGAATAVNGFGGRGGLRMPPPQRAFGPGRPPKRAGAPPGAPPMRQSVTAGSSGGGPKLRRMSDLLIPGAHDNDDCSLISVQKADVSLPIIQNVHGNVQSTPSLPKEAIRLSDQITLSVRNKEPVQTQNQQPRGREAKAVANILAARGITVTTGNNGNKRQSGSPSSDQQDVSLNLNNAVSIIPTQKNKPIVATVDLTDDPPPKEVFAAGSRLLDCHLCNKQFLKQAALNSHVVKNHPSVKLPYRCGECTAKYPSADGLATHQRIYHVPSSELGLPVVDLSKPNVLNTLANLGITNYVPLSSLDQQAGGYFGIPIVSIQAALGSASSRMHSIGASDILSLGPIKQVPRS